MDSTKTIATTAMKICWRRIFFCTKDVRGLVSRLFVFVILLAINCLT